MISINQIRAARALLNWTQEELAQKSGLSLRALNSIERGLAVPRIDTLRFIQETFEKENIEFGDCDGVRRRTERLDIVKLEGEQHLLEHLLDVIREVRQPGEEILFNLASEEAHGDLDVKVTNEYFDHIHRYGIKERVLIATGETFVVGPPSTYRWQKPEAFNHVFFIVYGTNIAFQITGKPHRTIIIRNPGVADMFRRQFDFSWNAADIPWFAKSYKGDIEGGAWSLTKAEKARAWITKEKEKLRK